MNEMDLDAVDRRLNWSNWFSRRSWARQSYLSRQ